MNRFFFRAATVALLLSAGMLNTACEKQLDLQPEQSIDAETALTDAQAIESAVVGAYSRLYAPGLYGTNLLLVPDLLANAGYINWQGTFQSYREIQTKQPIPQINVESQRTWREAYRLINISNLVLEALPVVRNADQRAEYEGEARMLRGLMYFELVRLFGQNDPASPLGVPLALTPNNTVAEASPRLARASVQQVYTQILADLQAAETSLPESNQDGRFDKSDATALLARVYLQQGRYAEARDKANDVIQNSGASLNNSVLNAFSEQGGSNGEVLFEVVQNEQNNAGTANDGLATFYSSNLDGFGGRGDVQVLQSFADQYGPTDERGLAAQGDIGTSLLYIGDGRRAGAIRSFKWNRPEQNIPIIRLAEMYLIRAEANQRLGTAVGATPLADVNRIRTRAGATPRAAVTLADILLERELELAFEGFRVHDYKRTGRAVGTFAANDPKLIMPIPLYEINLGNALPQNPGY